MRLIDKNKTIADIKAYQSKVNIENNFSHKIYEAIQEIVHIVEMQAESIVENVLEDDGK